MEKYNIYHDDDEINPLADDLVICFSKFLESKGIWFFNGDSDAHQLKYKCAIYGEDFRTLQAMVQDELDKRLK